MHVGVTQATGDVQKRGEEGRGVRRGVGRGGGGSEHGGAKRETTKHPNGETHV